MTVGERIKSRRKELGISADDLAARIGVSRSTMFRYEKGDIEKVPGDTLVPIANALHTTPAYLMGWEDETYNLLRRTAAESVRLDEFSNLSEDQQIRLLENARSLPDNIISMPRMNSVPLIGTIACGVPILAEENVEEYVDLPEHIKADFALRCRGDSMTGARINDGDIVYIRQQSDVQNGEIAAVVIDDEATLKRLYRNGGTVILQPENPAYPPLAFSGSDLDSVHILGKAVAFTSII